jgi:hypothetical protein
MDLKTLIYIPAIHEVYKVEKLETPRNWRKISLEYENGCPATFPAKI